MNNSKRYVYLAGPIEVEGDTWREKAKRKLSKLGFDSINPLRGEQLKAVGRHIQTNFPNKLVVERDKYDLMRAKVSGGFVLLNLNPSSTGRNPMGALMELQWAVDHNVPVVGIIGDSCSVEIRNHPWVLESLTLISGSLEDAIEKIIVFFL